MVFPKLRKLVKKSSSASLSFKNTNKEPEIKSDSIVSSPTTLSSPPPSSCSSSFSARYSMDTTLTTANDVPPPYTPRSSTTVVRLSTATMATPNSSSASSVAGSTASKTKFKDRPMTPEEVALRILRKQGVGVGLNMPQIL